MTEDKPMKPSFPTLLILLIAFVLMSLITRAWGEDALNPATSKLPVDVATLLNVFEADSIKIQADADKAIAAKADTLRTKLTKAQESATKKGDLDGALAIKDAIEKLPKAEPKAAAPRKTWAVGTWEVLWSGFRSNVTFEKDGTISRQDGTVGKVVFGEKDALTLTWDGAAGDGGNTWTIQAPEKSDPGKTLGKNIYGTTFRFTKQ
jgi:hypothetical protein